MRHDGDDPYLVVAADKGTATFGHRECVVGGIRLLARRYVRVGQLRGLRQKMAITARGGWECVKRHFREMGIDTQAQDFTVAGIGDMASDVFGNAMLHRSIRLVAVFNHQHIFIDPRPTSRAATRSVSASSSYRARLGRPDTRLISKGGAVFARCETCSERAGTHAARWSRRARRTR